MDYLLFFLGIPLGILASIVAWYIVTHAIKPKLLISEFISKVEEDHSEDKYKYRFAIRNYGSRNILNLRYFCIVKIEGLTKISQNTSIYYLTNEGGNEKPFMSPKSTSIFKINIDDLPSSFYNSSGVQSIDSLEDLLKTGSDSFIQILVICDDEFTGSSKLFKSEEFRIDDVIFGHYERDSLKYKEIVDKKASTQL